MTDHLSANPVMSSSASSHPQPSASDAADTLVRHFAAEVRDAYLRFRADRRAEDADIVVLAVVQDHIPEAQRQPGTSPADHQQLMADLGFDSVTITEMVFFLEDLFQVRIANEEILRVRTVGDLRAFIRQKLGATPAANA